MHILCIALRVCSQAHRSHSLDIDGTMQIAGILTTSRQSLDVLKLRCMKIDASHETIACMPTEGNVLMVLQRRHTFP